MPSYTFFMQETGKLPDAIKQTLANVLPSYAGKKVRLSIDEAKDKRSLDQNAYMHGVIIAHVRKVRFDNGDPVSIEQAHEDLLKQFAPTVECRTIKGEIYTRPMRSKEMSVKEMADYLTAITAFMANFGAPVPIQGDV